MNEYTRRDEVRWTFVASMCLVIFLAPAVFFLVTAKGKTIPDPAAQLAAKGASDRALQGQTCASAAEHLLAEVDVFKSQAKAAHLEAPVEEPPPNPKQRGKKKKKPVEKAPDASVAWPVAQPSHKLAKVLAGCRETTEATSGVREDAAPAWDAVVKVAAIPVPPADKTQQIEAAKSVLKLLEDAPIDKVVAATKAAGATLAQQADETTATAATATVVEALPEGLIPRRAALGVGIAIAVLALLLSYFSVRVASGKRLAMLGPLRQQARTAQPGLHAAAILRLASQHNGGEPGLVVGGALGGLLAAWALPADADVFIAGVMAGLLLGLVLQWAARLLTWTGEWRKRATELAEVEKPTIPIVLVLSGVNPGREGEFVSFFNGLGPVDAATTVEKLAAQAEERILVAADAGAAMAPAGGPPFQGPPGMPPGPGQMPPPYGHQ